MSHPLLRLNDGRDDTSPQLRPDVTALQQALSAHGFTLVADGVFGSETDAAVRRLQREHGLLDDGVVGPMTWAVLDGEQPPDPNDLWPTTISSTDAGMLRQVGEATKYKGAIEDAAAATSIPPFIVAGVGSRESAWGLALKPSGPAGTGDFAKRRFPTAFRTGPLPPDAGGFGRGLLQIDYDAHTFARTGNWQDPTANILYGCQVLSDCLSFVKRKTDLAGTMLWRAALAAYNCGPGNVLTAVRDGRDVDFYTAGHDYSKDVLDRAGFFHSLGWTAT